MTSWQAQETKIDKPSLKNTPRSDHKSSATRELEKIEASLRNVQLALEILTGVCATLPDPDPVVEDEEEEVDDDDEDADVEGDADMDEDGDNDEASGEGAGDVEMDTDASNPQTKTNENDTSTPTLLPSILDPLLLLIQPTSLSFPPISSDSGVASTSIRAHPPTTSALGAIHVCALECLNNATLALAVSSDTPEGAKSVKTQGGEEVGRRVWNALWTALGAVGLEGGRGQERRREMWEVAVGVMWGIGGVWKGSIVSTRIKSDY